MDMIQVLSDGTELAYTGVFTRVQNAGPRKFNVRGTKADAVRELVLVHGGLTRKQVAAAAGCSVSRVAEVLWGLDVDGVEYTIAKQASAAPTCDGICCK